jgi:hypothetical protein
MLKMFQVAGLFVLLTVAALAESTQQALPSIAEDPATAVERIRVLLEEVTKLQAAATNDAAALVCVRSKISKLQTLLDVSLAGARRIRILEQAAPTEEERHDEEHARLIVSLLRAQRVAAQAVECLPVAVRTNQTPNEIRTATNQTSTATVTPVPSRSVASRNDGNCISQGETARLLAQAMELVVDAREETVACAELTQKGVVPPGGWQPPKCMTVDDFYVVAVKVLNLTAEPVDDPAVCGRLLREAGLAVDSILPPRIAGRALPLHEAEVRAFLAAGRAARPGR